MSAYLLILVSTVLANNFVLVRFLGLCPFMGVSNKVEGAVGMSVATMFLLYRILGIFLPLITSNCAVLGVALLNVQEQHNLLQSALYGFGAAAGFGLVLVMFSAMRERLTLADVPLHFRGAPIGLITAGLMALAFMGFTGLARV